MAKMMYEYEKRKIDEDKFEVHISEHLDKMAINWHRIGFIVEGDELLF